MGRERDNNVDPIFDLLLSEIRVHEDEQLEFLRLQNVELKAVLAKVKDEDVSRWDKFLTIDRREAYQKLYHQSYRKPSSVENMYDQIVAEG